MVAVVCAPEYEYACACCIFVHVCVCVRAHMHAHILGLQTLSIFLLHLPFSMTALKTEMMKATERDDEQNKGGEAQRQGQNRWRAAETAI